MKQKDYSMKGPSSEIHKSICNYNIMKVAKAATRPTATLEDDIESAPLVDEDEEPEFSGALEEVALVAGAAGMLAALPAGVTLLRAALRSWGIINGVDPEALRSIEPSSLRTSAFWARKVRVYMTFSAT